jgi:subtilase family serine protease
MSTNASAATPAASNRLVFGPLKTNILFSDLGVLDLQQSAEKQFACLSPVAPVRCYTPQQIRSAYTISTLLSHGITGDGRTIVIVDAYSSPTIAKDLKYFDKLFHLPDPEFSVVAPDGVPVYDANDPNQNGWASEISLDVEWAHAVAPGAKIVLVEAKSSNDPDILSAMRYAVQKNLGDVISQSYGEGEACSAVPLSAQHDVFREAVDKGITLIAASGDEGAAQQAQPPLCGGNAIFYQAASTPATDPLVTAVGATQLDAGSKKGAYGGEIALNETDISSIPYTFASGGGFSTVFKRPSYQDGVPTIGKYRGVPDVAYSGAINGGVLAVQSSSTPPPYEPHVYTFGGTSVGSPQWAGIAALADQFAGKRLGFLNKALYTIGKGGHYDESFHDITFGNNTFHIVDFSEVVSGYSTRKGWDPVTGWGTPKVATLVPLLAQLVNKHDSNGL